MQHLTKILVEYSNDAAPYAIIILILIYTFNFLKQFRDRMPLNFRSTEKQIEINQNLLKNLDESTALKEIIQEKINQLKFYLLFGIDRNKQFRAAFEHFFKKHADILVISDLRRSRRYFRLENGSIIIRPLTTGDKLGNFYNIFIGLLGLLFALLILFSWLATDQLEDINDLLLIMLIIIFAGVYFLMVVPVWAYLDAKKIKAIIESDSNSEKNSDLPPQSDKAE